MIDNIVFQILMPTHRVNIERLYVNILKCLMCTVIKWLKDILWIELCLDLQKIQFYLIVCDLQIFYKNTDMFRYSRNVKTNCNRAQIPFNHNALSCYWFKLPNTFVQLSLSFKLWINWATFEYNHRINIFTFYLMTYLLKNIAEMLHLAIEVDSYT